ncbi:DUF4421 domain-containing protein [Algoriphagus namhaensis]
MKKYFLLISIALLLANSGASAQEVLKKPKIDSAYIEPQPDKMNLRLYISRKYTDFIVRDGPLERNYRFEPNSGINLGLGFTYQKFTLNAAFPVGFLNPDRIKDWPGFLDLQSHIYPRRWIIDLFGQFYRGYTLDESYLQNSEEDYLREDIRLMLLGVNANYLFRGERISLSAAYNQSSIQKKSGFSPFIGFEVYGGHMKGDSLFLPPNEGLELLNFSRVNYFQIGPNAGLASSLAFGNGFYFTAVASANVSVGFSDWRNNDQFKKWGFVPTYFLRGFFGYNGERFSLNANYVWKNLNLVRNRAFDQAINTGNFRINFIYKIQPSDRFKDKFNKVNPALLLARWVTGNPE